MLEETTKGDQGAVSQDQLQELKIKLADLKAISQMIRYNNFTSETMGDKHPIGVGYSYSSYMRRPVQDLLKWISGVELMFETMLEEAES